MKALPVVLILALLAACSAPAPTPDAPATEGAIAAHTDRHDRACRGTRRVPEPERARRSGVSSHTRTKCQVKGSEQTNRPILAGREMTTATKLIRREI